MKQSAPNRNPEKLREFNQRARESSARSLERGRLNNGVPIPEGSKARPRRRAISPASPAQRAAVKGEPCIFCGAEKSEFVAITPMHVFPRGMGGCDHVLCVLPGCVRPGGRGCATLYDDGKLDLWALLVTGWPRYKPQFDHATGHADPVTVIQRCANARIGWLS